MKIRHIIFGILLISVIYLTFFYKQNQVNNSNIPNNNVFTYVNSNSDMITVDLPYPGAVTGKEFSIIGKARGMWYFEATFPIKILDKDGNLLIESYAKAMPDPITGEVNWMTENFVPFKSDVIIPQTYIGNATLILERNNASGLPENDASLSFPFVIEY